MTSFVLSCACDFNTILTALSWLYEELADYGGVRSGGDWRLCDCGGHQGILQLCTPIISRPIKSDTEALINHLLVSQARPNQPQPNS